MSPETHKDYCRKLEVELSLLGTRLLLPDTSSKEPCLGLAKAFLIWSEVAVQGCGSWSKENLVVAQKIVWGIEGGRPLGQALDRLSKTMSEASQYLESEMFEVASRSQKEGAASSAPTAVENAQGEYLNVTEEEASGFRDFMNEAPEHLEAIEQNLLSLSKGEVWDVLQVYRGFHTIKGICGFINLPKVASLTHKAEACLEPFKQGQGRPSEAQVDWLLLACDMVREQVQVIEKELSTGRISLLSFEDLPEAPLHGSASPAIGKSGEKADSSLESTLSADASMRISIEKMDSLLEAVGELAICQSQVTGGVEALGLTGRLVSESSRLAKISRQLQDIVLSLRMVPVQPLFQRMSRLARDLSRKTGKPLQVELEGAETELDKRMVEELVEPLIHLIRNAVDHGIETEESRIKAGKPAEAKLSLRAGHQGGDFVLRVEDDGAGLPFEKMAKKAADMGLFLGEGANRESLIETIFVPGFSTAEKITEVSGRGVGMDAVRRKIQRLKGSIEVETQEGKGTAFILRIPLTLALIDGILVRVGSSRYILPSFNVRRFLALSETERHQVSGGNGWMTTSTEHIPVVDLSKWFGCQAENILQPVVVHVEVGGRKACLIVDEVIGKQQVVVKGLGEHLQGMAGVAGGAIFGDGQVGFILDINALVQGDRLNPVVTTQN